MKYPEFEIDPSEEWRDIEGYEGKYMVSNFGQVLSLNFHRTGIPGLLKPGKDKDGYFQINLYKNRKKIPRKIHRLVAEAFCQKPSSDEPLQVCHENGINIDNRSSNLRWDTQTGNQADRLKHGTDIRGEKHGKSFLTEEKVREIKKYIFNGEKHSIIAKKFGVSRQSITSINIGDSWAWLKI